MNDKHSDDRDDEKLRDLVEKIGFFLICSERPVAIKNKAVRHGDRDRDDVRDKKLLTDDREGEVKSGKEQDIEDRQVDQRIQYADSRKASGLRGCFIFHYVGNYNTANNSRSLSTA